ncbi:DUF2505 domain-containing protein [Rhodococcus zopfii]|uniref:DUF2505 domain-containing protein n=1 Tax=Rhodococcus zopfii TaxID=43772 RepID=A0ABU3WQU8_9NOCA|nr:DUF2505 domain-containing protein [Rhodococcus zopfii]MDV2476367.1 DUF2505 domain-containing protein [Rhodococcus zopfii]
MPKKFEFTAVLDHPAHDVHAALIDERYWRDRIAGSPTATVRIENPDGPGTLRVVVTERAEPADLPALVRGVVRGPMVLERSDDWGTLGADGATGVIVGGATGIPVDFRGTSRLQPTTEGTVLAMRGEVTVKIPVVGGRIEGLAAKMIRQIIEKDRAALAAWLTR